MNHLLLWVTTVVLGAAAALMTGLAGLLGSIVFLLLVAPLVVRGHHLVALSGLLTGFGAFWLLLMERQFASGGTLDNAPVWTAVGVVPLVIGCTLLALVAVRALRQASAAGRS
jgi:hypothetical protein